jgi:2-iminobutanoate/2-iminopropanoate deaminase
MSKHCILYKINDTMKRIIASPLAPKAVGPYSQAVEGGSTLYISGQLPIDASTGKMPETIEEQTRQALTNLGYIAAEAGYTLADAVKVSVLLDDIADFAAMNGVYATFFTENMPARVCYEVAKLPMGAKVEIDAILCK